MSSVAREDEHPTTTGVVVDGSAAFAETTDDAMAILYETLDTAPQDRLIDLGEARARLRGRRG